MGFKQIIRQFLPQFVLTLRDLQHATKPLFPRNCPMCGYQGYFDNFGRPPRLDASCRECGSLERHRLFWLWFNSDKSKLSEPVLHFAPESILKKRFKEIYENYKTADLFADADLKLNIEKIDLDAGSFKTVICNHVLEHVSDRLALKEIYRVLSDDGQLVCSVPIIEGWERTYENKNITTPFDRELHFGQHDHVRYYGRDFRDRLRAAGFKNIQEITAEGQDVLDHGLLRGEKFFICSKT